MLSRLDVHLLAVRHALIAYAVRTSTVPLQFGITADDCVFAKEAQKGEVEVQSGRDAFHWLRTRTFAPPLRHSRRSAEAQRVDFLEPALG